MTKSLKGIRSAQVLKLLAEHGPMSVEAIRQCMVPEIQKRRLNEIIQRLCGWHLLERRTFPGLGPSAAFYSIKQSSASRAVVGEMLDVSEDRLLHPHFRRVELLHSNSCALWKEYFKRLFPDFTVLRDFEFYGDKELSRLLLIGRDDRDMNPDIVLISSDTNDHQRRIVAVEIERNPKSKERLARKLAKYATEAHLDGVIYLCEGSTSFERIRNVYSSTVLQQALRIKHYGSHFVLFSNSSFKGFDHAPQMVNARLENVNFEKWIQQLLAVKMSARRDHSFALAAGSGWQIAEKQKVQQLSQLKGITTI